MESEIDSKWFADLPRIASIDLSRRYDEDAGSSKAEIGHRPERQGSSNATHGIAVYTITKKAIGYRHIAKNDFL